MKKTFGEIIQDFRRKKGWSVRTFIEQLGLDVSQSYITRIEVHGEIPSPYFMGKVADALDLDFAEILKRAKVDKVKHFEESLEKKYQRAISRYRLQRTQNENK